MNKYGWRVERPITHATVAEKEAVVEDLAGLLKVEAWAQARRIILERTDKPLHPEARIILNNIKAIMDIKPL